MRFLLVFMVMCVSIHGAVFSVKDKPIRSSDIDVPISKHGLYQIDDIAFSAKHLAKSGFSGTLWTDGIVYYTFSPEITEEERAIVLKAMQAWEEVSDVRFIPWNDESNYLEIIKGDGNWAQLGMQGGKQQLSIAWFSNYVAIHELGHTLGLLHEHQRSDRDRYIQVHFDRIDEENQHNFRTRSTVNVGLYDFLSVMHYEPYAFTNNGQPTIEPLEGPLYDQYFEYMGSDRLSRLDEYGIAVMYGSQKYQPLKLGQDEPEAFGRFGSALDVDGNTMLVGIPGDNHGEHFDDPYEYQDFGPGAAAIFERQVDGSWLPTATLRSDDSGPHDFFGGQVALSGTVAAVSSFRHNNLSGAVYLYRKDPMGDWNLEQKLETGLGNELGISLDMDQNTLVVGAWGDHEAAGGAGAVYVYEFDGENWVQTAKLAPEEVHGGLFLGKHVVISAQTLVAGAYSFNQNGEEAGGAFVFRKKDGVWQQVQTLVAPDAQAGDWFGHGLAIDGGRVAVAAPFESSQKERNGAVYIFDRDGNGLWNFSQKLMAKETVLHARFGWTLELNGDRMLVGSPGNHGFGDYSGSAYVFEHSAGSGWQERERVDPESGTSYANFSESMCLSKTFAFIGASGDDRELVRAGVIYAYEIEEMLQIPKNLVATVFGPDQVELRWQGGVDPRRNFEKWEIQVENKNHDYLQTLYSLRNAIRINDLEPGAEYIISISPSYVDFGTDASQATVEVSLPENQPYRYHLLQGFNATSWAGLVLVNHGSSATEMTITAFNAQGEPLRNASLNRLEAGQKWVGLASTLFLNPNLDGTKLQTPLGVYHKPLDIERPAEGILIGRVGKKDQKPSDFTNLQWKTSQIAYLVIESQQPITVFQLYGDLRGQAVSGARAVQSFNRAGVLPFWSDYSTLPLRVRILNPSRENAASIWIKYKNEAGEEDVINLDVMAGHFLETMVPTTQPLEWGASGPLAVVYELGSNSEGVLSHIPDLTPNLRSIFPYSRKSDQLYVYNSRKVANVVEVTCFSDGGQTRGAYFMMKAGEVKALNLLYDPGTIVVQSTAPCQSLVSMESGGSFEGMFDEVAPRDHLLIGHIANSQAWRTNIFLVNSSMNQAVATVQAFNELGVQLFETKWRLTPMDLIQKTDEDLTVFAD